MYRSIIDNDISIIVSKYFENRKFENMKRHIRQKCMPTYTNFYIFRVNIHFFFFGTKRRYHHLGK